MAGESAMPRKAIALIDGTFLWELSKSLDFTFDFKRLLELLRSMGSLNLTRAYYFSPVFDQAEHDSVRKLLDWLTYNGFTVVERLVWDESIRRKEPVVLEMSVKALELAPHVDEVFLFGGNGDLTLAVEALKRQGKVVTVFGTIKVRPSLVSDELRRAADVFIELGDYINQVEKL